MLGGVIQRVKGWRFSVGDVRSVFVLVGWKGRRTEISNTPNPAQPLPELDLVAVDLLSPGVEYLRADIKQPCTTLLPSRKQDTTLFKRLSHGGKSVRFAVLVDFQALERREITLVKGGEVPAGKDMGRGKGRGGLHAVEEQHLVGG